VTDTGGLDDRSFNFLANKGLVLAEKNLAVDGTVFLSKSDRDYIPNLTRAARNGSGLVIGVGFLMAEQVAQVAKRFPKVKFAIIDNSGVASEFKTAKPTNVRGILFKEQEAGYLVGFLAAKQVVAKPFQGQTKLGAVGGLKLPSIDRFIAGYYAGAKRASAKVTVTHSYSQDFLDPASCKEIALSQIANGAGAVFQVAGGCGLGALSAAKEKGVFGIGVDADQAYLGAHVLTSATKKVDVAVYQTIEAAKRARAAFRTNFNVIFTVANGGVGYGKISSRVSPALRQQVEAVRKLIASGKIKNIPQSPPATTG
jgi:basic membrane protein A and related proteins